MEITTTAALLILSLMGTACSGSRCSPDCRHTERHNRATFRHVSDLGASSVAPWTLIINEEADREPEAIEQAVCKNCALKQMVAKPIYIEISVYRRMPGNSSSNSSGIKWCRCPFKLAVGCTCVIEAGAVKPGAAWVPPASGCGRKAALS